jgi:hypothetical protein
MDHSIPGYWLISIIYLSILIHALGLPYGFFHTVSARRMADPQPKKRCHRGNPGWSAQGTLRTMVDFSPVTPVTHPSE